jgi:hypothetical protein
MEVREPSEGGNFLDYARTCEFARSVFQSAGNLYSQDWIEKPGLVSLDLGLLDVLNQGMLERLEWPKTYRGGKRFPDEEFRATVSVPFEEFLTDPLKSTARLFDEMGYAFDTIVKSRC